MLLWAALCPLNLGELQGPTSHAAGSLKQLKDAGCTCTLKESHWMRTMTGEGLGLGSEVPTAGKFGGCGGESDRPGVDPSWDLCQTQVRPSPF